MYFLMLFVCLDCGHFFLIGGKNCPQSRTEGVKVKEIKLDKINIINCR
jgi:hypothetical protein